MDVDTFLATNQPSWDRLSLLVRRAGRKVGRLSPAEIEEMVALYQRAATHLSYARTTYRDPALTATLSSLVARAGAVVYASPPRTLRALGRFFAVTFPAAVWYSRRFVAVSAALFLVPAFAVGLWLANSPRAVEATGPRAVREAYVNEDFQHYYRSAPASQFASQVFTNNVQVSIYAFAAGIALCVPTAVILAINGANVGVAGGLFASVGQQLKFWGLILPHGLLELTAVFIAGGAGLRLGWTLIDPGDRTRREALADEGRRAMVIVAGLVVVFAAAGTIEGFVTGSSLPTWARVGVGVLGETALLSWLFIRGRAAAGKGLTGALGEAT
ncbi:MAG TPA: stage II sporulation protein M [Acidimicrobiales bacterium]|nr:stage II sporulation protein M [Acidimicrobiales bacterium]